MIFYNDKSKLEYPESVDILDICVVIEDEVRL